MKSHPIFFAPIDEGERCPHGKVLPMPKTREQRAAERRQFDRDFLWGFIWAASLLMAAAVIFVRGCL